MNKRNLKIIRLYTISLVCILLYYLLDNSNIIAELVQTSEKHRYGSSPTFFLTGLFKYGLLIVGIGIFIILSFLLIKRELVHNSAVKSNPKILKNSINRIENRDLKLVLFRNFGQEEEVISEEVTSEIIRATMNSINWNEFHIVQLEDKNGDNYKALNVSGSIKDDGLVSGFMTNDNHILLITPLRTVEQMTEILLDFLKGEDIWRSKYKYE